MKHHHIIFGLTAAVLAFAIIFTVTATPVRTDVSVCVTSEGCFYGMTSKEQCESAAEGLETSFTLVKYYSRSELLELDTATLEQIGDACTQNFCCEMQVNGQDFQQDIWGIQCLGSSMIPSPENSLEPLGTACTDTTNPDIPVCLNGEAGDTNNPCTCGGIILLDSNQYCCSGVVSDNSDCTGTTPGGLETSCGNNQRDTWEQCDPTDTSDSALDICEAISVPGGPLGCTAQCRCQYTANDIDLDDEYCQPGENSEACTAAECEGDAPAPGMPAITSYAGEEYVNVSWSYNETVCLPTPIGFSIQYSPAGENSWSSQAVLFDQATLSTTRSFSAILGEGGLSFPWTYDTVWDVRIEADYGVDGGGKVAGEPATLTIGPQRCYENKETFCVSSNTYAQCLPDNTMGEPAQCGNGGTCYQGSNGHLCVEPFDCTECNEAYENLGEVRRDKQINYDADQDGTIDARYCYELANLDFGASVGDISFCFLAFSETALQEFTTCGEVTKCSAYTNMVDCAANSCQVLGSCTWNASMGACYNDDPELVDCTRDPDVCNTIPGCFLSVDAQGNYLCISTDTMSCTHYTTETRCTNANGLDQAWDMDHLTNQNITWSDDEQGFGKCKWGTPTGSVAPDDFCYKDSADRNKADRNSNDFENPVTTIDYQGQELPKNAKVYFTATDNNEINATYIDVTTGACDGITQKPSVVRQEYIDLTGYETGTYCLTYYSNDEDYNQEHVQQTTITINTALLNITNIAWSNPAIGYNPETLEPYYETTLTFNTNRRATCKVDIQGLSQGTTYDWPSMTATAFSYPHTDLPEDRYLYTIYCWNPGGMEDYEEGELTLDLNTRIGSAAPNPASTYRLSAPPAYQSYVLKQVSIKTSEPADCQYYYYDWYNFFTTNGLTHTAPPPPGGSTYYELEVRCTMRSNQQVVEGGPADVIMYAIDELPPDLTITDEEGATRSGNIILRDDEDSIQLTLTCNDKPVVGNNRDWQFGEEQILIKNGNDWTPYGGASITYELQDGETAEFNCRDKAGNMKTNGITITAAKNDISGPERPTFSVVNP